MGNFCSVCYPSRQSTSLPRGESVGAQYSLNEVAEEVQPRCHIQRSYSTSQSNLPRSETLSLLGGPQSATSSSLKSEKKSLASKLSGTLNRTNSGEQIAVDPGHNLDNIILLTESKSFSEAKITSLYEKYKDGQDDSILSEGIEEFCIDLQLKPDEFKVLGEKKSRTKCGDEMNISLPVLAWQFGAEQMCRFTRAEFLTGCRALKADTLRAIQTRLPEVAAQVKADQEMFRDLYRFTYKVTATWPDQINQPHTSYLSVWT